MAVGLVVVVADNCLIGDGEAERRFRWRGSSSAAVAMAGRDDDDDLDEEDGRRGTANDRFLRFRLPPGISVCGGAPPLLSPPIDDGDVDDGFPW